MNPQKNTTLSAELEEELSRLPKNERLEFIRTWELLGKAASPVQNVPELDDSWTDLQSRIHSSPRSRIHRRDRRPRRSSVLLRRSFVAGGVLLAAATVLLWMWQRPVTAVVPPGELSTVTLADGSIVQLNSGTRLRFRPRALPGTADRLRSVELEGEAFFDVVPADSPFLVETSSAVIEVLGTRFNVRARTDRGAHGTEVTLASGRVRVSGRNDSSPSLLLTQPGERTQVHPTSGTDSSLVADIATLDYVLAWRRKAFAAIDRPVAAIVAELERRYALEIYLEDDVNADHSMTLLYGPDTGAERILHDICLVQGCRYRPTTRGFSVFMPDRDSSQY